MHNRLAETIRLRRPEVGRISSCQIDRFQPQLAQHRGTARERRTQSEVVPRVERRVYLYGCQHIYPA
jgi:hypothetical protein